MNESSTAHGSRWLMILAEFQTFTTYWCPSSTRAEHIGTSQNRCIRVSRVFSLTFVMSMDLAVRPRLLRSTAVTTMSLTLPFAAPESLIDRIPQKLRMDWSLWLLVWDGNILVIRVCDLFEPLQVRK